MKKKQYYRLMVAAGLIGLVVLSYGMSKITPREIILEETDIVVQVTPPVVEEIEVIPEPVVEEPIRQRVSNDFNILHESNLTEEQLMMAVNDEYRYNIIPLIGSVVKAEELYGVNSLYLLSKLGLESGWGKHTTGTNNYAGWKDYKTGKFKNFDSIEDCVLTVAKGLSGSFKKDVGSALKDVAWRYCKDDGYLDSLKSIMNTLDGRIFN